MVLCAGFGTRLGQLTQELPKPMLLLQGHPLLAYILGHLKRQGFDQVRLNLHFRPEVIRGYFGAGSGGLALSYSHEPELLGTAGAVKNVENWFRGEEFFLVQYGDVLTDQDFLAMIDFHRRRQALVTLLLHQRSKSNSVVTLDETGRVVGFLERPSEATRSGKSSPWVNSGVCICAPEVLGAIPPGQSCDLPRDIFPKLIDTGRLFGFPLSGYRCAVDSPERLAEAQAALGEGICQIRPLDRPQGVVDELP